LNSSQCTEMMSMQSEGHMSNMSMDYGLQGKKNHKSH